MTSQPVTQVGDRYVLPTGQDDRSRLDLIHSVYGRISLAGLEAAKLGDAARAADIGCGTGTISRWMAQRIGASGRVDAIDIAPEQIDVAKSVPAMPGASAIHYKVGSAYEPELPESAFDIVFCRLVLCHLKEPDKAVAQMAKLLRKGGRLVLVDMDLRDTFTMPPCEFYRAYIDEVVLPYQTKIGVDYSVGLKIHELMSDVGLTTESISVDQPIFRDGPEKHLWEKTWTVALQRAAQAGIVTLERGQEMIAGMEKHTANPDVWVAVAKMLAAVGRKPS
ncbi:MAG TPA: methyltransferase domain-containing protein [Bauldia sp.]|nr:methyltransferase domain-containing protein [Bauldia sp.]